MLTVPPPTSQSEAESLAESRHQRRRRRLEQLEIPKEHVKVADEELGRGGFGAVYLADYNGRNTAAKVIKIEERGDSTFRGDTSATKQRTTVDPVYCVFLCMEWPLT